jgi:hypothetical protein
MTTLGMAMDGSKAPFRSRLARGQYDAGAGLCFLILLLPIFWSYEKDQRPGRLFGKRLGRSWKPLDGDLDRTPRFLLPPSVMQGL